MYHNGIPDPGKVGFIQASAHLPCGDFDAAIQTVASRLGRSAFEVDADGYEHRIIAASLDFENARYAWVEGRSKDHGRIVDVCFHLNVRTGDRLIVRWEVETYNPYFGCQIEFMDWVQDHFVLIYHEKHDTFVCSFTLLPQETADGETAEVPIRGPLGRHEIADGWLVRGDELFYRDATAGLVQRRALPGLEELPPWTAEQARAAGVLPPVSDEVNATLHPSEEKTPPNLFASVARAIRRRRSMPRPR